jgi:hypothetical protein
MSSSRAPKAAPHSQTHAAEAAKTPRPEGRSGTEETTCVRLTRKFAERIDDVDLSDAAVGDQLDLSRRDAEVLIAEGWAERSVHVPGSTADDPHDPADKTRTRKRRHRR